MVRHFYTVLSIFVLCVLSIFVIIHHRTNNHLKEANETTSWQTSCGSNDQHLKQESTAGRIMQEGKGKKRTWIEWVVGSAEGPLTPAESL